MAPNNLRTYETHTSQWQELLRNEAAHIDQIGIHAAVIVVQTEASLDLTVAKSSAKTSATSALRLAMRPTDRVASTSPLQHSILLSPVEDFQETIKRVQEVNSRLAATGVSSVSAFAHRRREESLLQTWARAQGELDRCLFRQARSTMVVP